MHGLNRDYPEHIAKIQYGPFNMSAMLVHPDSVKDILKTAGRLVVVLTFFIF